MSESTKPSTSEGSGGEAGKPPAKKMKLDEPTQKRDQTPDVISSTNKLKLTTEASFGDAEEIYQEGRITPGPFSTIDFTINPRREFETGDYIMHILEFDVEPAYEARVAILCRQDLCPIKMHKVLWNSNIGSNHKPSNYLNRYDWMCARVGCYSNRFGRKRMAFVNVIKRDVYGEEVEESDSDKDFYFEEENEDWENLWNFRNLVYFVDVNNLEEIGSGAFRCERENEFVFVMKGVGEKAGVPLGFILEVKEGRGLFGAGCPHSDTWFYGCLLVDRESEKCFAFVLQEIYTFKGRTERTGLKEEGKNPILDIEEINYTFDIADFKKD